MEGKSMKEKTMGINGRIWFILINGGKLVLLLLRAAWITMVAGVTISSISYHIHNTNSWGDLSYSFWLPGILQLIFIIMNHKLNYYLLIIVNIVISLLLTFMFMYSSIVSVGSIIEESLLLCLISSYLYFDLYVIILERHKMRPSYIFYIIPVILTCTTLYSLKEGNNEPYSLFWLLLLPPILHVIMEKFGNRLIEIIKGN